MIFVYGIVLFYIIWYYIGQGTRLASIDAPMLFAIQKTDGDLFVRTTFFTNSYDNVFNGSNYTYSIK